ncbi:putative protein RDM1 [Rosa chinensis]|uniref:Protein RDM1 n=1 Tax=Rosa chinensis TaxID=74649 RepID=A0A2P6SKF7_ROSCH|nr:putative protein RDM1 [Rosa chinensis]
MLRRRCPLSYQHLLMSDSETDSDDLSEMCNARVGLSKKRGKSTVNEGRKVKINKKKKSNEGPGIAKEDQPELHVVKVAEEYQEHMKKIPIPMIRRSDAMFITWHSLANSMKQFYGQPLHYLTHVLVKQWDQSRIGNVDEEKPMDNIIHSRKAESTIWGVEEVHRRCTSHIHLAKLWLSDPDYSAVVGDVITSKLVA